LAEKISAGQHAKFYKSSKKSFVEEESERFSQKTVKMLKGGSKT
jgi:hypothetical protein